MIFHEGVVMTMSSLKLPKHPDPFMKSLGLYELELYVNMETRRILRMQMVKCKMLVTDTGAMRRLLKKGWTRLVLLPV